MSPPSQPENGFSRVFFFEIDGVKGVPICIQASFQQGFKSCRNSRGRVLLRCLDSFGSKLGVRSDESYYRKSSTILCYFLGLAQKLLNQN